MVDIIVRNASSHTGWHTAEDFQNLFSNQPRWRLISHPLVWRPPTDVYETEDTFIVRVDIAGMRETDFTISLVERSLTIRGIRQDITERRAYHQMEIPFGEFITEVELPYPVATNEVEAIYRDGFLRIILPKARPQHIKVESQTE
jgi:HSP20 family protein